MKKLKTLTPFDAELFLMIESLTGKKPEIAINETNYLMTVHLAEEMSDNQKDAIADAIRGRIGKRLLSVDFKTDRFVYEIEYGEDCGIIIDSEQFGPGDISDSNIFYIPETALRGLMVLSSNFERLVRFVGNGSWENRPDGNNVFQFLNASGTVFCDAPEGSYLVYVKPGLYRVATKEEMSKFAMM